MSRTFALRFVFAVLLLAVLACNPLSSLPNPAGLAGTAVSGIAGTQGASLAQTAAAAVAGGLGPTPSFTPQPTPEAAAPAPAPVEEAPAAPAAPAVQTYTVEGGDSLWAIAERFYGDGNRYGDIASASGISNPDLIHPGQVLTIP